MLTRMLTRAVQADPARAAVVQGNRRVRYDELLALSARLAAGLRGLGVGVGDCVAVALPNCPEFVAGLFGCALRRAIMLPLDPRQAAAELSSLVADAGARVVLADSRGLPAGAAASVPAVDVATLLQAPADTVPAELFRGPTLYLYTSGSTTTRKRLCCTQENLHYEALNFAETMRLTAADNILCTIPLHHSYGLGNCLLDAVYAGSTLVLTETDEVPFAARCPRLLRLIAAEAIRFYPGVPYQFQALAGLPAGQGAPLTGLRLCVSSGDVLPHRTYERFLHRFGIPIRSLYGSTEAGSIAINTDPGGQMEAGSLGLPLRNVTIAIRDAEGKDLPAGVDGEIWVRSPTIPPTGYDNRPDLTQKAFRAGFYNTGDIGRRNQRCHLLLAGRKQSFITIAGNKVDTSEVEEVLESHPGVREAAVLGVEVPRLGTLMKAALVTDGPCRPAEIREYCRQRLAFHKVPRLIEAYPSLPRSAMGKVLKSELGGVESYLEGIRNEEAARIVGRLSTMTSGKRRNLVTSLVQTQAAAVLGQPPGTIPRGVGFVELGMDSFGAIELHARLEYLFDQDLPQTFAFDHPTVDAMTESLLGLVEKT
jgi:long-chain acyl-CoA synthetase